MSFNQIMIMHITSDRLTLTSSAFFPDSLSRLGHNTLLISATGDDSHSDAVFNYCKHMV